MKALHSKFYAIISSAIIVSAFSFKGQAQELNLPDIGDASGGIISAAQEYELGQRWQRMFRAQVATSRDPFMQEYIEQMLRNLSTYSDLKDKRLDVLVVENPSLNAFAVPGGVVGVNTGLFSYAETEEQFASVLAHELAHLSQRHFARRLDEQRNNSVPNLAAMLASILVLATAGGDAGIAAISATQAASIDSQLRFSRQMEQEADRIGMETMVRADLDPYAMPEMFEQMLHASRFQRRPPEFLITHPLPESRVSDSRLRAQQYSRRQVPPSEIYNLMKVRARVGHEKDLSFLARTFQANLKNHNGSHIALQYGLALVNKKLGRFAEANTAIDALLKSEPDNLLFIATKAEIEAENGEFDSAINRLQAKMKDYSSFHPLNVTLAEVLMKAGRYKECEALLLTHSQRRPKDDYVWYLLAEAHGLSGHIMQVHTARTEYFLLNGMYDKAENHIRHALKLTKDEHTVAKLELRLKEVQRLKRETMM